MPFGVAGPRAVVLILVIASLALVHWSAGPGSATAQMVRAAGKGKAGKSASPPPATVAADAAALPAAVTEMREAILTAVRSGAIDDMRTALEWNELKPELADQPVADPIAFWKTLSGDGKGREILAVLGELLDAPFAVVPLGKDLENNRVYVWPKWAEMPPAQYSPADEVGMLRLVSPAALADMKQKNRYLHWRIAIGADGVWHSFTKGK